MIEPYYQDEAVTLYHGDCRDVIASLPSSSVDACVTDPPYELGFMGRKWDASGIAYDKYLWAEVWRVLKPFAGSGTTAEACIIEGFRCVAIEITDDYLPLIIQRITKPIEVTLL